MNRTEVMHWLLNLQTDAESAIKSIKNTEAYDEEDADEILVDKLPKYISYIEEDISRIKENMK